MKRILIFFLLLMVTFSLFADQIQQQIEFSGTVTDSNGEVVHGSVELTFSLYDSADELLPLWQEVHQDVLVENGTFTVILGSHGTALDTSMFSKQLWLAIVYEGNEMKPRNQLYVTPYAVHAANADDVMGKTIHPDAVYTGEVMTYSLSAVNIDADSLTVKGQDVLGDNRQLQVNSVHVIEKEIIKSDRKTDKVVINNVDEIHSSYINAPVFSLNGIAGNQIYNENGKSILTIDVINCPNTLELDTDMLVNGNIGIGVKNPLSTLDVSGDVLVRGNLHFSEIGDAKDYISFYDTNTDLTNLGGRGIFTFNADLTAPTTWDTPTAAIAASFGYFSGNVGVGVKAPLSALDVNGDARVRGNLHFSSVNDSLDYISFYDTNADLLKLGGRGIFTFNADLTAPGTWDTPTAAIAASFGYFSGNVGVGVKTPLHALDVNGDILVRGNLQFSEIGDAKDYISYYDTNTDLTNLGGRGIFTFNADLTAPATWDNPTGAIAASFGYFSGKIGVGVKEPLYAVDVKGDLYIRGQDIIFSDAVADGSNIDSISYTDTAKMGAGGFYTFLADTTLRPDWNKPTAGISAKAGYFSTKIGIGIDNPSYNLQVNGSAGKTNGGSWTNSSDIRLKDIEGAYEFGLAEILKLNTIRFRYKPDNARGHSSDTREVGFVAQEVMEVIPDAVSLGTDGYYDFNMHTVNVAMVNAIQEQQEVIDGLQDEVQSLQEQLKELDALKAELREQGLIQ